LNKIPHSTYNNGMWYIDLITLLWYNRVNMKIIHLRKSSEFCPKDNLLNLRKFLLGLLTYDARTFLCLIFCLYKKQLGMHPNPPQVRNSLTKS